MNKKNQKHKSLTLDALVSYNREVMFPWMQENLVTKKEFDSSKNENTTAHDKMFKNLEILLTEKTVREHQDKKEKKLWAIIIKALQEHRILSPQELEKIAQLEIF